MAGHLSGQWAALRPPTEAEHSSLPAIDGAGLALWALKFTPRVTLLEETVLLEAGASGRLFGGMDVLRSEIATAAEALGVPSVSWGPTGLAAMAFLRSGRPWSEERPLSAQLDRLPLATVSAVARHAATLERLGCRTLGDVRKLPRGGISRRFDDQVLTALDCAYGLRPELFPWVQIPESFCARLEFLSRVETAPALIFGARRLLQQLASWLVARHAGVATFTLRWQHDTMRSKSAGLGGSLTVRTAAPTQSVEHLGRLLSEHLGKVQLAAPAGELELLADDVSPITEESRSLLPEPTRRGEAVGQTLERIQIRLGQDRVRRPVVLDDHRLEWMQAWRRLDHEAKCPKPLDTHLPPLPLPTWLLKHPMPLAVQGERPVYQGPLVLVLGPDRIEGGWWHRAVEAEGPAEPQTDVVTVPDEVGTFNVQRDYWVALSAHAGVLWVFQQRIAGNRVGWFLHGHFA